MPPREARAVYMLREYFTDFEFQTELSAEDREAYMGLAQLADDSGWLVWVPGEVAAHVYRYATTPVERLLQAAEHLQRTRRLRVFRCGHAVLLRQPRLGAKRAGRPSGNDVEVEHKKRCRNIPERNVSNGKSSIPNLTLPNLSSTPRARPREAAGRSGDPKSFKQLVKEAGYEPEPES